MSIVVPGTLRRDARPPIEMDAAPAPGTAIAPRPTVVPRRMIGAGFLPRSSQGHRPTEAAVRRFWTALIGPGAVADLLRLMAAAASGRRVKEPVHLPVLATEGLAAYRKNKVLVPRRVPFIEGERLQRLHPTLRAEYRRALEV